MFVDLSIYLFVYLSIRCSICSLHIYTFFLQNEPIAEETCLAGTHFFASTILVGWVDISRQYTPVTNIAMEIPPFVDVLPIGNSGFPLLC